ncbi:aminoacyl--tRNA ligase-related protein [Xenorhabdus doucetiae]|uniref:Prolyl-tRNA synthetase n=1 Tax=Xenorhabdus doucetiae TaxID=351671 RepID=A0A068QMP8_9GAMM|nr:aminoacyl--tRNA ligase-related protein [Xenorhabdus doucetiae]TYO93379.1 prolyl-tRNA synthetase [Xenorhabdus doucetiae]CDG15949.1 putative Proline--tRNA ligase [Xenorhabdus doucetiae]
MRLSKQLFPDKYRLPKLIDENSTRSLLNSGPFYQMVERGLPLFLPIGNKIMTAIEQSCIKEAELFDYNHIDMTQMIPTNILSLGEQFSEGFLDQFIFLKGKMERYHLLSTPEPLLLNFMREGLLSYRQLPLKMMFSAKFYRQLSQVHSILKTREFKMLAGACLYEFNKNSQSFKHLFHDYMLHLSDLYSLPIEYKINHDKKFNEYFYLHPDGDEKYGDVSAISLSMAYEYGQDKKVYARYCSKDNKKMNAKFVTFGLGLQRLFFAILDNCRDKKGFNIPKHLRPFDICIIPQRSEDLKYCQELVNILHTPPDRVLIDDRSKVKSSDKERFADYLGIPQKLLIHKHEVIVSHRDSDTLLKEAFQLSQVKGGGNSIFHIKLF